MQDILDRNSPIVWLAVEDDSSSKEDEDQTANPKRINSNYGKALEELEDFEVCKKKRYRPILDASKSSVLSGETHEIMVGPVTKKGKDLETTRNLADYICQRGQMKLVHFFKDHKKRWPTLWIVVQCEASRRLTEVGCERFFSLSGYISAPRRTRLNVRTYERLAMLATIIQNVYIDKEWVAEEYLRRCKSG